MQQIIGTGNANLEWVDAANDYPELLSFDGLEQLGFDFKGTANVLVADTAAMREAQPRKGMRLLFVIREEIAPCDVNCAKATLVLGNGHNPENRPIVVSWRTYCLVLCQHDCGGLTCECTQLPTLY